ncbi:hypothetical protein HMPREF9124_1494 [Oribacterium sp. oral taxon 108 str. F0425]|nr:hypothetical protein HMPREF9124_1494 [Oribacterium sp. oral taxon 108 str. F0425]
MEDSIVLAREALKKLFLAVFAYRLAVFAYRLSLNLPSK